MKGARPPLEPAEPTPHVHARSRPIRIPGRRRPTTGSDQPAAPVPAPPPCTRSRCVSLELSLLVRSRRAVDRARSTDLPNQQPSTCPPILTLNAPDSGGPPSRGKKTPAGHPGRRGAARAARTRPEPDARPAVSRLWLCHGHKPMHTTAHVASRNPGGPRPDLTATFSPPKRAAGIGVLHLDPLDLLPRARRLERHMVSSINSF